MMAAITMAFLTPRYDPWVVAASVLIASLASYVALDLARRVRAADRAVALRWWVGGSLAMGSGIWSMHFVGMLAFSLPVALGYTAWLTFGSWVAAVAVSTVALWAASRGSVTLPRLAGGSLAMGGGICAMHYIGMAAMDMAPGIVWDAVLVVASAAIAVGASAAALLIFFWLREPGRLRGLALQAVAAVVMGLAISSMHYTGMAAASFPEGSVCLSADALSGANLSMWVVLASVSMLALTLFTSVFDAHMQGKASRHAHSLEFDNLQLRTTNEELQRRAFVDPLTSLPNGMLFEDRLMQAAAQRSTRKLAVMFIGLDGFKPVNDSFGHAVGDVVLQEAALRLRREARRSDTVARIGSDEFLLLMEELPDAADSVALAGRLVEVLAQPFHIAGRQVQISCSIGIAVYPDHGQSDKLVRHADAAMRTAKRAGGGAYALFEWHMDVGALQQLDLQSDLRHAVERGQLELHYQPKFDGRRGQISGVEALLRWRHPQHGMVSPDVFIPIAERSGLMLGLGHWVIEEACRQMRVWADQGLRMRVAINVSVQQLRSDEVVSFIEEALQRHKIRASQLMCEVTESVAMDDIGATQSAIHGLERIGVYLSIDDFGTGYSSLSYLRQLPARQLKIDRSFIRDIASSADAHAIVDAVIRLAHALGLKVVAEGVETAVQRDILLKLDCDELQGFFFARPMPADELLKWAAGKSDGSDGNGGNAVEFMPSLVEVPLKA
jgi:diguanylate cyclase (GGDEF)-like protein